MPKHEGFGSGIDLKEFFEASVTALRDESKSGEMRGRVDQRNCGLFQRPSTGETLNKRALADAARALTALWKMQAPKRTA